jgi:hypothetical protein
MPTITTTETRPDTTTLFGNEMPAFQQLNDAYYAALSALPAERTVTTSEDELTRAYTITLAADLIPTLQVLQDSHLLDTIKLRLELKTEYNNVCGKIFDSELTESLYHGLVG